MDEVVIYDHLNYFLKLIQKSKNNYTTCLFRPILTEKMHQKNYLTRKQKLVLNGLRNFPHS